MGRGPVEEERRVRSIHIFNLVHNTIWLEMVIQDVLDENKEVLK